MLFLTKTEKVRQIIYTTISLESDIDMNDHSDRESKRRLQKT